MRLQNNPFFILGLTCSAGRREIVAAVDELSFLSDTDSCSNAQNELINLNKRLNAELCWFPSLKEADIQSVQDAINNGNTISTDELSSISKLNATLYNFSISDDEEDPFELGYSILDIDEQYSALDPSAITDEINFNRKNAKISEVQENIVTKELNKKRDDIRKIISDRLSVLNQDTYIELITMLAEKCIADDNYADGIILSDVVDQYEIKMQAELEDSTEKIKKHIENIQDSASDVDINNDIATLIQQVQEWDKIAQPLQLKSQASGMPHEISEDLGRCLRSLAVELHNEKGKTQEALSLVDAMKGVFAELDGLSDLFDSDSKTLNNLIQEEKDADTVSTEMNALRKEAESLKSFATTFSVRIFIDHVKELDNKLKSIDVGAEILIKLRETLCIIARDVAIDLHNTKHDTSNALTIAKAIQTEFGDIPSLHERLTKDVFTLNQQLFLSSRQTAAAQSSNSSQGNSGCLKYVIFAILIITIMSVISIGGSSSSSNSNKSPASYSSNSSYQSSSTKKSTYSSKSSSSQSNNQAELSRLKTKIDSMESQLSLMQITIDNYENELDGLSSDIDWYESQYYATGDDYYYNAYYNAVDEYNSIYEKYSDKIDEYNKLYREYSDAIDEYNRKIGY